ncbi:MAG: chromosome partitioning protein ParA [Lachnospiraceae bacterium]|nr:chromosome partitioning protein ParA [Lachnospiraceae bacterium]
MRIKLAILESDSAYLRRVVPMFNSKFAEELEIYSFTEIDAAMDCLEEKKIDVFLATNNFKIDFTLIPKRCGFAYLVESLDIDSIDGHKAVCKFQKGDLIYKQVLSIYSEHMPNITGIAQNENGAMKTICFCSPCGGVGTSTAAAGCAIALVNAGYRVLYLNTEIYGEADNFFSCDGQFDFSDVIYAVKSNKTNRAMKLQSTVKQDATGVSFYSSVKVPLDMMEMKPADYITLQDEFRKLGCYDYVVVDMEFPKVMSGFEFFEHCHSVVLVTDGGANAEVKLTKAIRAVQIIDSTAEFALQPRLWLLRNKSASNELTQNEVRVLGSFPIYQSVAPAQMAKQLSLSDMFKQLI